MVKVSTPIGTVSEDHITVSLEARKDYIERLKSKGDYEEAWAQSRGFTTKNETVVNADLLDTGIKIDRIDHPSHYTWLKEKCGIEVIDIARHLDFCLGSALKYILRAGRKSEEGYTDKEKAVEDLKKAVWYINDKINSLTNNK